MERFTEGDIVHVNTGLVFKHFTKEYDAVLLWNGYNNQPLLTELDKYRPHWASYNEIESVIGHIDLEKALVDQLLSELNHKKRNGLCNQTRMDKREKIQTRTGQETD